ncbi:hypothetical protein AXG93_1200s1290 [Marchantia polymorpha subsp. ruderalis]|uniref:Uncharacterized protein n=1 Tax=Marchantia polymorpha subsp. ruderalis TaxID=1480154 RepID=A0A176WJE6_MARPO|nr:hypothetical protein AXG93_1200s1290 [Marchantia polymorpha subsp. ruderalis]
METVSRSALGVMRCAFDLAGKKCCCASKEVLVYDPCFNKWSEGAHMRVPREFPAMGAIGGKIAVMDDKLFAVGDTGGLVLDPFAEDLSPVPDSLNECWRGKAAVVNDKLFSWNYLDKIIGYDLRTESWRPLQVVGRQLPRLEWGINLVSVAGKLLVIGEHPGQGPSSVLEMTAVSIEDDGEDNTLRGESRPDRLDISPCAVDSDRAGTHRGAVRARAAHSFHDYDYDYYYFFHYHRHYPLQSSDREHGLGGIEGEYVNRQNNLSKKCALALAKNEE